MHCGGGRAPICRDTHIQQDGGGILMQTFLPYPDIKQSLKCLDDKRLGKQRVEAKQILDILQGQSNSNAWKNHPAVLMWKGHVPFLMFYYNTTLYEWERRGYKNAKLDYIRIPTYLIVTPRWYGDDQFHASHRSNLLRKNPDHYSQFRWTEPNDIPYFWPTKEGY